MDRNSNLVNRHNKVGGQAVIEGVMMKNSERVSLAVRKEDGSVEIKNTEFKSPREKARLFNRPIIRGIIAFFESLVLSFKTLSHSTDMLDLDDNKKNAYKDLLKKIKALPKFGNDIDEVDIYGREAAYTYTKPVEKYTNPRGGQYHAGLYPVSANVPLGMQTGATPDGRLAGTPIADGVSPAAGSDVSGPTAAANSVAKLDHGIASNGTLFNMKFHPSALKGASGIEGFISLIRAFFDQKGMHMQFNVVSRETLRDAQLHPENYKNLVVRVAGYSALFTTLSKSLQDDIINRTEQGGF